MKNFFEKPTQVAFLDSQEDEMCYTAGLAYGCFITCLDCGAVLSIDDVIADAAEKYPGAKAIIPLKWISLSEACIGDLTIDPYTGEACIP